MNSNFKQEFNSNYDENDYPNELCSSYNSTIEESSFNGSFLTNYSDNSDNAQNSDKNKILEAWNMNYHEAAIYLQEGLNNDKFEKCHPSSKESLALYLIVHNKYFYLLDFWASLLLLFLVFCEKPSVNLFKIPIYVYTVLEVLSLTIIAIELYLKIKWMQAKYFFKHTRTIIKLVTLIIMFIEVFVVMIRMDSHFRVTRALRPVFLIDNYYCGGIRRFIRQIIQSLPPIIDMIILLHFFILISALFAFYLFSTDPNDPNFTSFTQSFISLFVLITTANFPDVMMPSYYRNRYTSIFFILFLVIALYILTNLMLAVVYEVFTRMEKEKFRKLLLHRRLACKHAFRLLVPKSCPDKISFRNFNGVLTYFKSNTTKLERYLMFKTLDTNNKGKIGLNEFYNFYEFIDLKWVKNEITSPFYLGLKSKLIISICEKISSLVKTPYFEIYTYVIISLSVIWEVIDTTYLDQKVMTNTTNIIQIEPSNVSIVFISLFTIEILMRIITYDLKIFLQSYWNLFDFIIVLASIFGLISHAFNSSFEFVYILRCVRLLKLLRLKKNYRDIMGTFMFILIKRFISVTIVVLIVLYSFAIVGMELFSSYDLKDCCIDSMYEEYFSTGKNDTSNGYYYLNNFDNVLISYVTLFQLMVANDWQITMEGYSIVYSPWCRLYFIIFYLVTMVVITIVIAFVLEAFLFRMQYKKKLGNVDKDSKVIVDVNINQNEYDFCLNEDTLTNGNDRWKAMHTFIETGTEFSKNEIEIIHSFHGEKLRTKFLFSMKMYADEAETWKKDFELEENQKQNNRREYEQRNLRNSKRTLSC